MSLSDLSFSSPINKAYDESMCNKHAVIINLKREDRAARSCQILHNLGVVGEQTCPYHKTSLIIYNFLGLYCHLFSTNDLQIGKLTYLKVSLFSHVGGFLLTYPSQKFEKKKLMKWSIAQFFCAKIAVPRLALLQSS